MSFTVAELVSKFDADTAAFNKKLDGMEKSITSMSQHTDKHTGLMGASFGKVAGSVGLVIGAIKGFSAAKDIIFGFNSTLDTATQAFTTMLGSGEAAKSFLDDLKKFALTTPFEFEDLITSSQRLTAMGFAAKDVIPTMTAIGDSVAALGGGKDVMNGIILALGQMKQKGKVSAEEMNQMIERGIPAWEYLAKAIGTDVPTAMALAKKGAINADQAIAGILQGMEQKTGGMMAHQSQTFKGAMSNIHDAVVQLTAQAFRPFYKMVESGTVILANFAGSQKFQDWAANVSDAVGGVVNSFTNGIKTIMGVFREFVNGGEWETNGSKLEQIGKVAAIVFLWIRDNGPAIFRTLKDTVAEAFDVIKKMFDFINDHQDVFVVLTAAVVAFSTAWKIAKTIDTAHKSLTALNTALAIQKAFLLANPLILWVTAIVAVSAALYLLYKHNEKFRETVNHLRDVIVEFAKKHWPDFKRGVEEVAKRVMDFGETVKDIAVKYFPYFVAGLEIIRDKGVAAWAAISKVVMEFVGWIKTNVWPVIQAMGELFGAIGERISQVFRKIVSTASFIFATLWPVVKPLIELVWKGIQIYFDLILAAFTAFKDVAWPIIKIAFDIIVDVLERVWNVIKGVVEGGLKTIKGIIEIVTGLIQGDWDKVWQGIKDTVGGVFKVIKTLVKEGIDGAIEFLTKFPERIFTVMKAIGGAGKDLGEALINGIISGLSAIGTAAVDFAKAFGNALVEVVNTYIVDKINDALKFEVPLPFGRSFTVDPPDVPRLPKFHDGGIVPGRGGSEVPIMAQAGEAVLSIAAVRALQQSGVASAPSGTSGDAQWMNSGSQGASQPIIVQVALDSKVLASTLVDLNRRY